MYFVTVNCAGSGVSVTTLIWKRKLQKSQQLLSMYFGLVLGISKMAFDTTWYKKIEEEGCL